MPEVTPPESHADIKLYNTEDWLYEDFVVGLFPRPTAGGLAFEVRSGDLLKANERAREGEHALVIDEINRADLGRVLGNHTGQRLGVVVPAGRHTVELNYSASEFRVGFGVSGLTALVVLAALVFRFRRSRGAPAASRSLRSRQTAPVGAARTRLAAKCRCGS